MPNFSDKWDKEEENEDKYYNNAVKYLKNLGERVSRLELVVKNVNFKYDALAKDLHKIALDVVMIKKSLNML